METVKMAAQSSGGSQSSGSTRAFAQKLSKFRRNGSSSSGTLSGLTKSPSTSSSFLHFATGTIPLNEVVEPPDFEDIVLAHQPFNENDPNSKMLEFPDDDLEVTTINRQCRTVQPCFPSDTGIKDNPQLKDCIHCYSADWAIVNRRYQFRCSDEGKPDSRRKIVRSPSFVKSLPVQVYEIDEKGKLSEQGKSASQLKLNQGKEKDDSLPRGSWASSIFDLQSCSPDPLLPSVLERTPAEEVDLANEEDRGLFRIHSLFSIYSVQQEEGIERRVPATIPQEHFGQRILVKCLQLKLELEVEPIFASMALYDGKVKKKISENFYFDMNSEWCRKLVKDHNSRIDVSTLSRSGIFSITYPSSDVFLVIKLEKVLQQGDIGDCAEPYTKDTENPKHRDKMRAAAVANCDRLGKYRMPFAWTAIHLVDIITGKSTTPDVGSVQEKDVAVTPLSSRKQSSMSDTQTASVRSSRSSMYESRKSVNLADVAEYEVVPDLTNFRPVTLTVSSFFKQETDKLKDDDLYKFLADLKRPSSVLKRLKCIPGTLKLDISPPGDKPPYCLTSELHQVNPYPDGQGRPTKEIEEFAPKEVFAPFLTYKNLLYVYPLSVNYTSRSSSARNIAVKVEFLAGEDVAPLECLFGKSSTSAMQSEAWSAVTYHNKTPDFYEEVKVKLPAHLTVEHHLLFTFYHISCSAGKKADDKVPTETPIGYTWIPAVKEGRLSLGEFHLPVSLEKPPPSYSMLSPEVPLPGMKWLEGHKGVFHVAVRAVSSIHPQDLHIQKFLKTCHQIEGRVTSSPNRTAEGNLESALRKSIVDLCKAREEPLVRFLYLVLDKLILLLVRPPIISGTVVNIGQAAFESLTQIVDRLHQLLENSQDEHGRNQLLSSYITYVFSAPYSHSPISSPDHRSGHREPGRSASIPVGLQSKSRQKLSSSNPQLNATLTDEKPELLGCWEDDGEEITCEGMNIPGNRSSMAEGRSNTLGAPRMSQSTSTNSRKLVHEELALQWAVASGLLKEKAMAHAWFFFELMVKSMAQHLENTDKFFWARKSRFPEEFLGDIRTMVNSTVYEIATKIEDFVLAERLNSSLAFFLFDLFSLIDRGFVFELVKQYCKEMLYQSTIVPEASQLRLEFLRIVCSHEHYVTLNLPFPSPLYPSPPISPTNSVSSIASSASAYTVIIGNSVAELSTAFRQQHFLAGLVLSELALALEGGEMTLINQAIDTTRDLIAGHDSDTRYDEVPCRSAVAALYLPIVGLVIGALQQLHGYGSEENSSITPDVAMAIATSSIMGGLAVEENKGDLSSQKSKPQQFSPETTRNLLVCFLWVLKNVDSQVLKDWWSDQPASRLGLLLDVLRLCVSLFEYSGKVQKSSQNPTAPRPKAQQEMKAKLEEMMLGNKGAAKEMMQRHSRVMLEKGQSPSSESRLRWRKDQTQWRQAADQLDRLRPEAEVTSQIEGSLAAEVSSIVLDSLEHLVQTVTTSDSLRVVLSGILRVLLHCLNCNQSEIVLQNMFATQRSIVYKFPELLFEDDTELCADLCSRLLNHCSSAISSIRAQASSSLYLLMRQNFEIGNNFARVKMQVTMSLSTLVGTSHTFNEDHLRRSLKTIIIYAESDQELKTSTFPDQVRELVFNLHMILSDTVKMKEYQEDPEMLIDLMYRIAKGYQNSPDLRLTWLYNMAAKHGELNNHVEAAMCLVHTAGLVSEYLSMLEDKPELPIGCVSFEKISPNVLEESAISDDVVSPDEEGICTGKYFSENGLVSLLEMAANRFTLAQLFECVNEVYKLLIPILEARRDYKKLTAVHKKLSEAFAKIIQTEGKRMLGTYFRVGFYGSKFGDLDGEEYIYKEPAITKLPEVSHRLQAFYGAKFGADVVEVIKDSNAVEQDKLDPEKAYIQLTYVDPYFDEYELKDRITYFDKNFNLRRFKYDTPFTPSGKAHGELVTQYKRKTILTTANSFPYVKTRINVVHREQIVLSPIEVAIEDMEVRTKDLVNAVQQEPPDAKMLQMVLQGSIGATVNQGPLEIALVFLCQGQESNEEGESQMFTRHHHRLRLSFKEFVKRCGDALQKNKHLIQLDQRAYQKELERNYTKLTEKLEPLLKNKFGSLRGSMRQKEGSALLRKISMSFSAGHSVA
ncbi:dedicator of cytokinesis protein 7-like isoform X1 [Acropora muricata]|uniref:dedicator of cytokinesis protein 7-like isoform X1 n=1 Tax=Acropora muricata TaxID=159855 RepID=UPI0034E48B18